MEQSSRILVFVRLENGKFGAPRSSILYLFPVFFLLVSTVRPGPSTSDPGEAARRPKRQAKPNKLYSGAEWE
jgi:hypothetical protein